MVKKHWGPYHILLSIFLFLASFSRKFILWCYYIARKGNFKSVNNTIAWFHNFMIKGCVDYNSKNPFHDKENSCDPFFTKWDSERNIHVNFAYNSLEASTISYFLKVSKNKNNDLLNWEQFGYVPDHKSPRPLDEEFAFKRLNLILVFAMLN
jgi:hypothetical protein